jgi:hypothetical protein
MDGLGASPPGRCEDSPDPSEVFLPGKLSVFSPSTIGTSGLFSVTVLVMIPLTFKFSLKNAIVIVSFWCWVEGCRLVKKGGFPPELISAFFSRKTDQ